MNFASLLQSIKPDNDDLDSALQSLIDNKSTLMQNLQEFIPYISMNDWILILQNDRSRSIQLQILILIDIFVNSAQIDMESLEDNETLALLFSFCSLYGPLRINALSIFYNLSQKSDFVINFLIQSNIFDFALQNPISYKTLLIIGNIIRSDSFDFRLYSNQILEIIKSCLNSTPQNISKALDLVDLILKKDMSAIDFSFLDLLSFAESPNREVLVSLCHVLENYEDLDIKFFYTLLVASSKNILPDENFLEVISRNSQWYISARDDIIKYLQENIAKMHYKESDIALKVFKECLQDVNDCSPTILDSITKMAADNNSNQICLEILISLIRSVRKVDEIVGLSDAIENIVPFAEEMLQSPELSVSETATQFFALINANSSQSP